MVIVFNGCGVELNSNKIASNLVSGDDVTGAPLILVHSTSMHFLSGPAGGSHRHPPASLGGGRKPQKIDYNTSIANLVRLSQKGSLMAHSPHSRTQDTALKNEIFYVLFLCHSIEPVTSYIPK